FDVIMAEQFNDAAALDLVVLDHQQALGMRGRKISDAIQRGLDTVGGYRLDHVGEGAVRQSVLALFFQRNNLHWDVPRQRIELEVVEYRPTQQVGQKNIQRDC